MEALGIIEQVVAIYQCKVYGKQKINLLKRKQLRKCNYRHLLLPDELKEATVSAFHTKQETSKRQITDVSKALNGSLVIK